VLVLANLISLIYHLVLMAMSLPVPSSPSDNSSSPSSSPNSSHTPLTPPMSDLASDNLSTPATIPAGKRKPSRRANTAERRATHNAVERQRRETLNGRFLDLAGLLPNLSQIRRPSKSAIVNSSIAHIHASRRHRLIAARELRLLKLEADAVRRELNEWRDRSGLPRVEEPVRGDGFGLVLSGEVEVVVPTSPDDEECMDDDGDDEVNLAGRSTTGPGDDVDDLAQAAAAALLKSSGAIPPPSSSPPNPFAHSVPPLANNQTSIVNHAHSRPQSVSSASQPHSAMAQMLNSRQHPHATPQHIQHGIHNGPMIASHTPAVSFENPAMTSVYDGFIPSHQQATQYGFGSGSFGNNQLPPHILAQLAAEMESKAGSGWYNNIGQFTPPSSSGGGSPAGSPFGVTNNGYQRRVFNEDGRDSVGSIGSGRERSTSLGSINRGSPVASYELVGGHSVGSVPRWIGDDGLGDGMRVGSNVGNGPVYTMMM